MGFVEDPGADLPLAQGAAQRRRPELLGRDQENARVPQPHPVQGVGALGHGQQSVDRDAAADAVRFQARHLVRHECHQRRDHDRQRAGLFVTRQRRDLIAEGLAGAGGQDAEHVASRHGGVDDGPLHRPPFKVHRLGTEVVEPEPALELLARVMALPAPAAGGILAGHVPQPPHQATRLGELVAHPGRHDRIASRHRQPSQGISERPAASGFRHHLTGMNVAPGPVQPRADGRARFGVRRTLGAAEFHEEGIQGTVAVLRLWCDEPVPGRQKVGVSFPQGAALVPEHFQRQPGVQLGIVQLAAPDSAVLIMLHEMVMGIAGKGERAETEGVDGRQLE